jgi:hypothetical protein
MRHLSVVAEGCVRTANRSTSTSVLMAMFSRRKPLHVDLSWDDVVWGVRRRRGYSPIDDPRAHAGRTQHAFPCGSDAKALCGYRSQGRLGRRFAVPLASATEYNPYCRRCLSAIPESWAARESVVDATEPSPIAAPAPVGRMDIHLWPMPEVANGPILLPGPSAAHASTTNVNATDQNSVRTSSSRRRNKRRRRGTHLPKAA